MAKEITSMKTVIVNLLLIFLLFQLSKTRAQQAPYGGVSWQIPGIIEAENFDEGGEGIAYHDFEETNLGGVFRTSEGVDILNSNAGVTKIGYVKSGEWLEYSVKVENTDKYFLRVTLGSPSSSSKLRIEIDGIDKTGLVAIPNTGGYEDWENFLLELNLVKGDQVIRFYFESTDAYVCDIDKYEFIDNDSSQKDSFFDDLKTKRVSSDGTIHWQQVAPGNSGFANLTRYHPTIQGKVLQIPDMLNAYQTENNGTSWYNIKDSDGNGEFRHIRDAYYSYNDPEFGLAIEGSQIWKTIDGGNNWSIVLNCDWYVKDTDGTDREGWKNKIGSLGLDPNNKDVWYVGGGQNVRQQDWLSVYKDVTSLNPRGGSHNYEGKLWKTTNGGSSWSLINNGLDPEVQVGRIIINPKKSNQIFVSSQYGVYRSDNGGANWIQITNGILDNNIVMDMDYYYNSTTGKFILYLIDQIHFIDNGSTTKTTGGVFRSEDEGETWVNMNGDVGIDISQLTGGVPNNYFQYIAKWLGLSVYEAKSKYPVLPNNALQYFSMISVDPSREGALYIGFADPQVQNSIMPGRIWATSNNGENWINAARLGPAWEIDKAYWQSRGNPYFPNMNVGHSSPHMQNNNDYALRSCRYISVGVDGSVMMVSDHSTMLSTDHGASWNQVDEDYTAAGNIMGRGNSNLPGETITQDKRLDYPLLGSGEHNLWIPTNDGTNGRQALKYINSTQETVSAIAVDPFNADLQYITSYRQANKQNIFRSTNGGFNWENYGLATPVSNAWGEDMRTHALKVHPIDNNKLFFGITDMSDLAFSIHNDKNGFYFSRDKGKTFQRRNSGLPTNARVQDIIFDPRDPTRNSLFVAAEKNIFDYHKPVADGGLFHTTNLGESWSKVNTPSSVQGVTFFAIDHTNRIYIVTGYRGGGDGVWYTDDFGTNWTQIFDYGNVERIDVSPFDNNLIVISVGVLEINPGIYVSRDRGLTWSKSNRDIGIPDQIRMVQFDVHNSSQLWLATVGCGFYKGTITDEGQIQVIEVSPKSIDFEIGVDTQFSVEIVNVTFNGGKVFWKSSNPAIATVDQNGKVTPVSKGVVKVWATIGDGRYSDYGIFIIKDQSDAENNDKTIKINTKSNSCPEGKNGVIIITPMISEEFKIAVTGNSLNSTFNFSSEFRIENLESGDYYLIITRPDMPEFKEEYNLRITEPENLIVQSKVNISNKEIKLNIKGGNVYSIKLNNEEFKSEEREVLLKLKNGINKIEVRTDKECQGEYSKDVLIGSEIIAFPNPFSDTINIDLGVDSSRQATVSVFLTNGSLIYVKEVNINSGVINLNTSFLNAGVYILSVKTIKTVKNFKIIKN